MKDAFGAEGPLIRDWVKATFKGSDAGKAFLQRLNPPPKEDVRAASGLENMDEKALATSADSLAVMYKEIVANWGAADAVMIMRSIETQKKNGDYGGLGVLIGSEIQHSRVVVARFAGGVIAEAKTALESAK
jgi:hypothetical protein